MPKHASVAGDADVIGALPDEVLQRVLGFLEADEAVRTSVLARRWRVLWRSMPALRVTRGGSILSSRKFVDHLLNLRGPSTLDACHFSFSYGVRDKFLHADVPYVNRWIRYALLHGIEELSVAVLQVDPQMDFPLDDLHVVSRSLTKLELAGLRLFDNVLDFSTCPQLKNLDLTECRIIADNISSPSITCLSIQECRFWQTNGRICISAPGLISLKLINVWGTTPFFEDMPKLVTAIVRFNVNCTDSCDNDDRGYCGDATCSNCSTSCVLLTGLSAAMKMDLISDTEVFILKRDLRFCPTFRNLKTLLVSGWCVDAGQRALFCILEHSPVLEKLTIDLFEEQIGTSEHPEDEAPEQMVPSRAIYHLVEQSSTLDNLNTVQVKCHKVDQHVFNILKSLITYGIPPKKISIQQKNTSSECLSFTCTGFSATQS